jgi:hypothetical protein
METIFTRLYLGGRGNRGFLLGWRTYRRARARPPIVGAHGIGNSPWVGTSGFSDGLNHNARRRQGTGFFGQPATERLHELVVNLLAAVLSQELPHLDDVVFITAALLSALLEHVRAVWRTPGAANTWRTSHAHAWSAHSRTRRALTHWSGWPRAARAHRTITGRCTACWWRKLELELAGLTPTATSRTTRATTAATAGAAALASA